MIISYRLPAPFYKYRFKTDQYLTEALFKAFGDKFVNYICDFDIRIRYVIRPGFLNMGHDTIPVDLTEPNLQIIIDERVLTYLSIITTKPFILLMFDDWISYDTANTNTLREAPVYLCKTAGTTLDSGWRFRAISVHPTGLYKIS